MMMKITYTITIEGMRESQMRPILAALKESKLNYKLDADVDMEDVRKKANGKKKAYASNDDVLVLTGKTATKGTAREKILVTLEKMEVKSGIGSVTRKMLRDECTKKGQDSQIIYQLIREGYMKNAGE